MFFFIWTIEKVFAKDQANDACFSERNCGNIISMAWKKNAWLVAEKCLLTWGKYCFIELTQTTNQSYKIKSILSLQQTVTYFGNEGKIILPSWKCSAVFFRRSSIFSSSSAHSKTRRRPYRWVLWQSALNALWWQNQKASHISMTEPNYVFQWFIWCVIIYMFIDGVYWSFSPHQTWPNTIYLISYTGNMRISQNETLNIYLLFSLAHISNTTLHFWVQNLFFHSQNFAINCCLCKYKNSLVGAKAVLTIYLRILFSKEVHKTKSTMLSCPAKFFW